MLTWGRWIAEQRGESLRHLVVVYILRMPKWQVIQLPKLYSDVYKKFPRECHQLGIMGKQREEPKWKNEIRQGLHLAESQGLIKHVGTPKSGEWQRI
jgi:hypothetical protein